MVNHRILIVIICFGIVAIEAIGHGHGHCPKVKVAKKFRLKNLLGNWYEAGRYLYPLEKHTNKCVTVNYGRNNGTNMITHTQGYSDSNGKHTQIGKGAYIAKGIINIVFKELQPMKNFDVTQIIIGLRKDYAVVYSCIRGNPTVQILTRNQHPSQKIMHHAYKTMKLNKLLIKPVHQTKQDFCQ